ncbi:hypothetical protein AB3331_09350 [Streptococcus sp. H49]|uniref:hypothetical protein n=1 Tax=Streptococcus huangxiaojuni TaxID=3237239 RepID=UPI0034A2D017
MNEIIINDIKLKHQELTYYLTKLFEKRIFDDDPLNVFYKEVKKHLPKLTQNSPDNLQNYHSFIRLSYTWINSAIEDSDKEIFNRTLNKILNETIYILEKY